MRGTLCFLLQVKWTPRCPDSTEVRISLQRLNAGSSFISQDEMLSESTLETLQNALGLHLISKSGVIFFLHIERLAEFRVSKVEDI